MSRQLGESLKFGVLPQLDEAAVKRIREKIDVMAKDRDVKVRLDAAKLDAELKKAQLEMARLTKDREVTIKARTDLASARLVTAELTAEARRAGKGMEKEISRSGVTSAKNFADKFNAGAAKSIKPALIATAIGAGLSSLPATLAVAGAAGGIALGAALVYAAERTINGQVTNLSSIVKTQTAAIGKPASATTIANARLSVRSTQTAIRNLEHSKKPLTASQQGTLSLDQQRLGIQQQHLSALQGQGHATAAQKTALANSQKQLAQWQKEQKAFTGLNNAVKNLGLSFGKFAIIASKPLLKPFTDALNYLGKQLRGPLAKLFQNFFKAVAPYVPIFTTFFVNLTKTLVPILTNLLKNAQGPVNTVLTAFNGMVKSGIGGLFTALASAAPASAKAFAHILQAVTPLLPAVGKLAAAAARLIGALPVGAIQGIVTGFAGMLVAGRVAGGVIALAGAFEKFKEAKKIITEFNIASKLAFLTNPWVLLGVAVIAAAVLIVKYWKPISGFFVSVWKHIWSGFIAPLVNFFTKTIPHAFSVTLGWLKKNWPLIVSILGGPAAAATVFVIRHWQQVQGWTKKIFTGIMHVLADAWGWIWDHVFKPVGGFLDKYMLHPFAVALSWIKDHFINPALNAFKAFVRDLPGVWNKIKNVVESPVKFVVDTVYDKGIARFWNDVASPLHLPTLPTWHLATGGVIPGFAPGIDSVPAMLSPGEAVLTPGAAKALGYDNIRALNSAHRPSQGGASSGNAVHAAFGWNPLSWFDPSNWGSVAKHFGTNIANWGKDAFGALRNLAGSALSAAANAVIGPLLSHIPGTNSGFGHMIAQAPKYLLDKFAAYIKGHDSNSAVATSNVKYNPSAGVAQWRGDVLKVLAMEHLPASLANQVLLQIGTESGGNPNAINLTDINAQRGDPSRGLLQTIMTTFQAYHWPGTSNNIYDPIANIAAAINYARHVYGPTLMRGGMGLGSGHGYALGGMVPVFDHGGTLVPGINVIRNATGKPEHLRPAGGGDTTVVIQLPSSGNEFDAFLLQWLRKAARVKGGGSVQTAFGRPGVR